MDRFSLTAMLTTIIAFHPVSAKAGGEELSGDILTGLLPLTSYAIAHYKDDDEGERQLLRSTGASLVVNSSLRLAFGGTSWAERPNGSPYGFPSGHAGFVTSSAQFLQDRYGWKYGLPAYAVDAYVCYVRVDTGHHRWRDVAAGAAVSWGISKLFVTPENATYIAPVIGPDWLGLRWERSF